MVEVRWIRGKREIKGSRGRQGHQEPAKVCYALARMSLSCSGDCFVTGLRSPCNMERSDTLSHSLVPIELAVMLVRDKVFGRLDVAKEHSDPDAVATFIAATVPVYEYSNDPADRPRALIYCARDSVFKNAGRELHFLDGRPTKYKLAVKADDVGCVIAMLKEPESADVIRFLAVRRAGRRLTQRSLELKLQSHALREKFLALVAQCQRLRAKHESRASPGRSPASTTGFPDSLNPRACALKRSNHASL
jgi:hypothetical protein